MQAGMKGWVVTFEADLDQITDGRLLRGARSRQQTLDAAVQLASVEGLEGLSINRLAHRAGMSKSSVHALFGSKEALQLAVIHRTREILIRLVVRPARSAKAGTQRLAALGEAWMAYLEKRTFDGGCLISSASFEMDGRPGAVRDEVAVVFKEWLGLLATNVSRAIEAGELSPDTDPDQLAFELNAIGMSANWHHQLLGKEEGFKRGRAAWSRLLEIHSS